ncbi:MAG: D-xylose ABC transporter ATP-binding protein [Chloroflexi bacterium]|nr:D-xylose ABC transporter ATP-binding protein [Chloroflexota bacterium]
MNTILKLRGVSKQFPGVMALQDVDLEVRAGEIHALLGENGAGKSTLAKIIGGVYPPTTGEIYLNDTVQNFHSPYDAQKAGVGMLYQELNLLPELTIAENIFLGSEPKQALLPFIDWKRIHRQTTILLDKVGLDVSFKVKVGSLSIAQQQMVQLAKALHQNIQLLIMDEPTARLTHHETENFFRSVQALKHQGVAILFISHRLDEVKNQCDRATILRDGQVVATLDVKKHSLETISTLILGRHISEKFPPRQTQHGAELLRVQGLTRYGAFEDISFTLREGEILGITGLVGSGRTAILRAIFGLDPVDEGDFYVNRHRVQIRSLQDAIQYGIGLLTEDRQQQGLVLEMNISENIHLASLEKTPAGPFIDHEQEAQLSAYYIRKLGIEAPSHDFKTRHLSSGNQQKVILSKWLATSPHILLCDEPTQGVDIGGKTEIYHLMNQLLNRGMGIVMVSGDINEIIEMCDRVLVLHKGRIAATLLCSETDEASVLAYALHGGTS